ncbi:MAG: tetraacyldisaccharide 4'-kinase [Rugosibacter sp.]|nr:tetraacyldisaccharide 4'-kinase [Rugosibacter sp.]
MPPSKPSTDGCLVALWRRRGAGAWLLFPLSLCFRLLVLLRRAFYRRGWLATQRLPVPVVVIGNLTVGGAGKTPLLLSLAEILRARGLRPGIISRGYRGRSDSVMEVSATSDPALAGDEPVVLARRSSCPVFIGRDRVAVAQALLAAHPDCNLILSDDGLQHYRLARDVEIAVFDSRGVMNGWMLPAGPLREPIARLRGVDAVVLNAAASPAPTFSRPVFRMALDGEVLYRLDQPGTVCRAAEFAGQRLHAFAGIGAPQRFFDTLTALGLEFAAHSFPDHHAYRRAELLFSADALLTTEKDAVKLAALDLPLPVWVLPVTATVNPDLAAFILEKLNGSSPA